MNRGYIDTQNKEQNVESPRKTQPKQATIDKSKSKSWTKYMTGLERGGVDTHETENHTTVVTNEKSNECDDDVQRIRLNETCAQCETNRTRHGGWMRRTLDKCKAIASKCATTIQTGIRQFKMFLKKVTHDRHSTTIVTRTKKKTRRHGKRNSQWQKNQRKYHHRQYKRSKKLRKIKRKHFIETEQKERNRRIASEYTPAKGCNRRRLHRQQRGKK